MKFRSKIWPKVWSKVAKKWPREKSGQKWVVLAIVLATSFWLKMGVFGQKWPFWSKITPIYLYVKKN